MYRNFVLVSLCLLGPALSGCGQDVVAPVHSGANDHSPGRFEVQSGVAPELAQGFSAALVPLLESPAHASASPLVSELVNGSRRCWVGPGLVDPEAPLVLWLRVPFENEGEFVVERQDSATGDWSEVGSDRCGVWVKAEIEVDSSTYRTSRIDLAY